MSSSCCSSSRYCWSRECWWECVYGCVRYSAGRWFWSILWLWTEPYFSYHLILLWLKCCSIKKTPHEYYSVNEPNCWCHSCRPEIYSSSSVCGCLHEQNTDVNFLCVWWGHVITLTGRLLCSVSVWWACELWNMGSNVRARQTVTLLASRNSAASWWLFALPPGEQKQPFVNVHSGDKGWETETYFSMLFNSCWCLGTIWFFPLLYRPKQYRPFKCQAHAHSDC